jgi:hypothetical protein
VNRYSLHKHAVPRAQNEQLGLQLLARLSRASRSPHCVTSAKPLSQPQVRSSVHVKTGACPCLLQVLMFMLVIDDELESKWTDRKDDRFTLVRENSVNRGQKKSKRA